MVTAAGESATVFLETSLGTRLAVSFPARATTVADLKRQVSAEHAACFPRTGPIAVTSFQVQLDGSWFRLTDSMAVQAAFHWVKGPWRLLVETQKLHSHPHARKDAKCGTGDTEPNAAYAIAAKDCSQYMLPHGASQGSGNLASGNSSSDTSQMNQQDKPHEGVEDSSDQSEDGIIMPQENSDLDLAAGDSDTPLLNQEDKPEECVKHASGPLEDGSTNTMPQQSSDLDLAVDGSDIVQMNQQDKPHTGGEHASDQCEYVITMPQESLDVDLAAGVSDTPLPNQGGKPDECVKHASSQLEDGNTMPQQSSYIDLEADDSDTPPMNQQHNQVVKHASGQREDGITMPQESSDLGVATDKDNGPVGGQEKDIIAEPRGKKRFREEDKSDGSIAVNSDDSLSSLASSTLNVELSEKKSSGTEQANLNHDPLPYKSEDCSHGLREKPSGGRKESWTSGVCDVESSKSDIPPCVEFMERDNFSDKEVKGHRGDVEEPRIAGLCAGESSCKGSDVPHCFESMKEDSRQPASNDYYLDKGKYEEAASSVSKENEPCFRRGRQRIAVRKVSMSKALKLYAFSG